jgi:hypothetical protein
VRIYRNGHWGTFLPSCRHCRQTLTRVSTVSTNCRHLSTNCRPTVDQLSTNCRQCRQNCRQCRQLVDSVDSVDTRVSACRQSVNRHSLHSRHTDTHTTVVQWTDATTTDTHCTVDTDSTDSPRQSTKTHTLGTQDSLRGGAAVKHQTRQLSTHLPVLLQPTDDSQSWSR